ncbi:MAG: ABC transporter permease [Saccharospirillum sp.]|nr:ABC transporter permease [Saccharospirillum sp.]
MKLPSHWSASGWLVVLIMATLGMQYLERFFRWVAPGQRQVIYQRDDFLSLMLNHASLVGLASIVAITIGVGTGILVTRAWGRDFLPTVSLIASVGQTFPPVAVLALCVPLLGFGAGPVILSLILYGLLPIVRNTLAGIGDVEPAVIESARGMGMSGTQILWQVEIPLAFNVILAGIRTSVTINIATAAIGSTIGARTLGDPVIAGLINNNIAYTLQGAILIGLLAVTVDRLFEVVQSVSTRR